MRVSIISVSIVWMLWLTACKQSPQLSFGKEEILSNTETIGSCPYITQTPTGKTVVSWVEQTGSATLGTLHYRVLTGDTEQTVNIPTADSILPHAENMPKIIFQPNGHMIAMFGRESNDPRNKYAGKVFYTQSFDNGKTWEAAQPLVTDTASYDQRYFDMALLPNGEVAAVWLDNRKHTTHEGSSLYFATTQGKQGFQGEHAIGETICQCCRTKLLVDAQGAIHVAFRDIVQDTIRDMAHILSTDNGQTFSPPVRISTDNWVVRGCPHTGPTMVQNAKGLHFAWFTMGGGEGVFFCSSFTNGNTYTQKENISNVEGAKHPQLGVLSDNKMLLVWDEMVPNKTGNNRIGIQLKNENGTTIYAGNMSADTGFTSFPVLRAYEHKAVVAYKRKEGTLESVCVQTVTCL
ncbi:hypothetical protein LX64_04794 [Chitinophaga skermanii]|uniref:BNR repeat protein n=1 Tax=Chitinophaga skermanii TaxID=331697 RepID=A0A327Q5E3_9BACT|nr:sialidase family protein [Chitinophaga skermanii]RAI98432.1 hypothetical protein LX64_04794 [Chitinophaga skermanii]